jgi:hypothetical protein
VSARTSASRHVELAPGALLERFQGSVGPLVCWICNLPVDFKFGYASFAWSEDRHTRASHTFCLRVVLRYAQSKISEQAHV